MWLDDMTMILSMLMVFVVMLITFIFFILRGKPYGEGGNSNDGCADIQKVDFLFLVF